MKRSYPQITLVTVRCSCCNENAPHNKDNAVCQYDPDTEMVVCPNCEDDYVVSSAAYGYVVVWADLPSEKLDYDVREYEPDDYTND